MATTTSFSTIGAVRERLHALGLPATTDEIRCLSVARPAERLKDALAQADVNPAARTYIERAIADVRLIPQPSANALVTTAATTTVGVTEHDKTASASPQRRSWACAARQTPINSRLSMVRHGDGILSLPPTLKPNSLPIPQSQAKESPPVSTVVSISPSPKPLDGRESFHIYGGKSAIELSPGSNSKNKAVVFIDAATSTGPKTYDWSKKIQVMLTPDEMLITLAVVLGSAPSARFQNHGEAKDKWIEIQHQGASLFFKVGQGSNVRAIPINAPDAYKLAALLCSQVRKNTPEGARTLVNELVAGTLGKMLNSTPSLVGVN